MSFWQGRHVLITGAAGFVGSHLARVLLDRGAHVTGLDVVAESPSLRVLGVSIPIVVRSVESPAVAWDLAEGRPEVVFHLAGVSHIRQAQETPLRAWEVNVRGTWNVLEACRQLPQGQIQAVVCASSNHVLGSLPKAHVPTCTLGHRAWPAVKQDSARQMWLEDDPPGQPDVYGTSKSCVDLLVKSYGLMGLPVAALRHVNCFGADPHASHLVTGAILSLLEGKAPVIRSDGTPLKGYLGVEDVCQAYLTVAEQLAGRPAGILPGEAVHAAAPPISVLSLVNLLIGMAGLDLRPNILGEDFTQSGYVECLDDSRLRGLGWRPRPLTDALLDTLTWYRNQKGMAWLSP